jgi:agmatine/peptidylarginine deiminase
MLLHAFNADNVVMLGLEKKYNRVPYMFHIDQAVFFPKEDVAVVIDPKSISDDRIRDGLNLYVQQLEREGFDIIKIPSTEDHVTKYQSYANAIPIELPNGKTNIILPSFGNDALEKEIKKILEDNEMVVTFVKDIGYEAQGNVHCITGAIARSDDNRKITPIKI